MEEGWSRKERGKGRAGEREEKSATPIPNSWISHCYNGTFAKSVWSIPPNTATIPPWSESLDKPLVAVTCTLLRFMNHGKNVGFDFSR